MIYNLMKKKNVPLIFSLFCGLAYFGIALSFISAYSANGSMLLGFFFGPAIICGTALFILKAVKMYIEEDNERKITFLFWSHILLAFVSVVLVLGALI